MVESISSNDCKALFNALLHIQLAREFTSLKFPGTVSAYGPPFDPEYISNGAATMAVKSPFLTTMCRQFVFTDTLLAVRDAAPEFWRTEVQVLLERLAEQNLSDSYDKGKIGKRKSLGMACIVYLETVARGMLLKLPPFDRNTSNKTDADWEQFKSDLVHTDLLEELIAAATKSEDPSTYPKSAQAARAHVIVSAASLLHLFFVASPTSNGITRLVSQLVDAMPWFMLRQVVKAGNVANLISGFTKLFLAKPPFASSNLLQTIISTILNGDKSRIEKQIKQIRAEMGNAIDIAQFDALEAYPDLPRTVQMETRNDSLTNGHSIVESVFLKAGLDLPASSELHSAYINLLALLLSRRDLELLIKSLCSDDILCEFVRDIVKIFTPVIREGHKVVDLTRGISDLQNILNDAVAAAESNAPLSLWIEIVLKHESSFDKFAHEVCQSELLRTEYTSWFQHCLATFRPVEGKSAMETQLDIGMIFSSLSGPDKDKVQQEVKDFSRYYDHVISVSEDRWANVGKKDTIGPGEWIEVLHEIQLSARVTPFPTQLDYKDENVLHRPSMVITWNLLGESFVEHIQDILASS